MFTKWRIEPRPNDVIEDPQRHEPVAAAAAAPPPPPPTPQPVQTQPQPQSQLQSQSQPRLNSHITPPTVIEEDEGDQEATTETTETPPAASTAQDGARPEPQPPATNSTTTPTTTNTSTTITTTTGPSRHRFRLSKQEKEWVLQACFRNAKLWGDARKADFWEKVKESVWQSHQHRIEHTTLGRAVRQILVDRREQVEMAKGKGVRREPTEYEAVVDRWRMVVDAQDAKDVREGRKREGAPEEGHVVDGRVDVMGKLDGRKRKRMRIPAAGEDVGPEAATYEEEEGDDKSPAPQVVSTLQIWNWRLFDDYNKINQEIAAAMKGVAQFSAPQIQSPDAMEERFTALEDSLKDLLDEMRQLRHKRYALWNKRE